MLALVFFFMCCTFTCYCTCDSSFMPLLVISFTNRLYLTFKYLATILIFGAHQDFIAFNFITKKQILVLQGFCLKDFFVFVFEFGYRGGGGDILHARYLCFYNGVIPIKFWTFDMSFTCSSSRCNCVLQHVSEKSVKIKIMFFSDDYIIANLQMLQIIF